MKKFWRIISGNFIFLPLLLSTSCGTSKPVIVAEEFNNNFVYVNTFSSKKTNDKKFSMLPDFNNDNLDNLKNFVMKDNYFGLNCNDAMKCEREKEYTAQNIMSSDYNNPLKENKKDFDNIKKIQFSYDKLARSLNVMPSNGEIFYKMEGKQITIDETENTYYFNALEESKDLILFSEQNVTYNSNNNHRERLAFYNTSFILNIKALKSLLNIDEEGPENIEVQKNTIQEEENKDKKDNSMSEQIKEEENLGNKIVITVKESRINNVKNYIKKVLNNYDESLVFEGNISQKFEPFSFEKKLIKKIEVLKVSEESKDEV
ncbi:hypothetical protein [Spiroplasma apis]|uniref:Lipoprotein n=1 Tax=Spiroplasma apis B31 TaxID=1276258 RepID=V5RI90_SPIAP|nr:hypothetical protein [Spiroplasma apis]AHB36407.1 hypothetical protein SAPIS_v1c05620 [Spiroplasma apis B31]